MRSAPSCAITTPGTIRSSGPRARSQETGNGLSRSSRQIPAERPSRLDRHHSFSWLKISILAVA